VVVFRLSRTHAKRVAKGAEKDSRAGNPRLTRGGRIRELLRELAKNLAGGNAGGDLVDGGEAHPAVRRENEDRRFRDPSFFARIVYVPLAHDVASRIRQNWKGKTKVVAHGLRLFGRVDRNGYQGRAGGTQRRIEVAIFRQLAKAERSPVASIEENDERSGSRKPRQALRSSRGIGKVEIRRDLAWLGDHREQSYILALPLVTFSTLPFGNPR
jgi:hypothetical protein